MERASAKRMCLTLTMILTFCAIYLMTGISRTAVSSTLFYEGSGPICQVHTIHTPGLPVRIKGDIVSAGEGQGGMALRYSITNTSAEHAYDFEIAIYVLNKKGRVKAGQVWRMPVEIAGNSVERFSRLLTNKPTPGDSVVAAIQEVSQGQNTWRVDAIPFLQSARIAVTSDALGTASLVVKSRPLGAPAGNTSLKARLVAYRDGSCGDNFCATQTQAATNACGGPTGCGVSSFSCDQANCSVSWSCNRCQD